MKRFSIFTFAVLIALTFTFTPHKTFAAPDNAFIVNSANDTDDGQCNGAHCSLREAINAANANIGLDTINFNIGGCPCIIYPASQLPAITDPVIINGYSESGALPADNHNPAVLKIMLRGYNTPGFPTGLKITGGGSTVKGLIVNTFTVGIWLHTNGGNTIEGNFIGTFTSGKVASPNGHGILISHGSGQNVIGGNLSSGKNVIAGNTVAGIRIDDSGGSAEGNVIIGNNIGQNVDEEALGNGTGIVVRTAKNVIGTTGPLLFFSNHIGGNLGAGIELDGAKAIGNEIHHNLIGSIDNAVPGNGTYGILIHNGASRNKIGKPGQFNFITRNGAAGVAVVDNTSQRNSIRGNYFFENGGLGVDLGDNGTTMNDAQDSDTGPNAFMNFPVIKSANATTKRIKGKLSAAPNTTYKIDFYYHLICDPLGYGEGVYMDSTKVTTDAGGTAKFNVTVNGDFQASYVVIGVAVDRKGNTSEFGKCKLATQ